MTPEAFTEHVDKITRPGAKLVRIPLERGDKRLMLSINLEGDIVARTQIVRVRDNTRTPGSTTLVYKEALEIMREAASILDHSIEYQISTKNQRMVAWARDPEKGMGIFHWDRMWEEDGVFKAQKWIHPNGNNPSTLTQTQPED